MQLENGWVSGALCVPSPNYNARPEGCEISLLVIHNISLPPKQFGGDYIEQFFCNCLPWQEHPYFKSIRDLQVSSHFLIKRDGQLVQFVSTKDRAWHAGASSFCGVENCNDFSLGIELEGADDIPYESPQYATLVQLTRLLQRHYPHITRDRIAGHSDIAPGRKTDPGEAFDWPAYLTMLEAP